MASAADLRRTFLALVATAVALSAAPARAQTESAAQVLFEEGRRLLAAGDVAAGCAKLAESQRLDPAGGTLMNLAACHDRLGKTATAWAEFNDALAQAKRDGRDDRAQEATRRIEALTPRLAKLTVNVASAATGLEVKIDDTLLGSASWATPIPVDPGEHDLRASAPGNKPWSARVTILAGASQAATVPPLERLPPPPPDLEPNEPPATSTRRIVAYSAGGLGVVAIGIGTYFGFVAVSKKKDSDPLCSDAGCTPDGASLVHDANRAAWAADIGIGVGIAALAAGAILFLTSAGGDTRFRSTASGVSLTW